MSEITTPRDLFVHEQENLKEERETLGEIESVTKALRERSSRPRST